MGYSLNLMTVEVALIGLCVKWTCRHTQYPLRVAINFYHLKILNGYSQEFSVLLL